METKKECVHVKTQEEWDYVNEKMGYKWILAEWSKFKNKSCINLSWRGYNEVFWYKSEGFNIITFEEFKKRYEHTETFNPQPHYDNSKGSLYKVAEDRKWNSYQFDIVKRIDRAMKKGKFEEDLQKTKDLIDLWLLESKKQCK